MGQERYLQKVTLVHRQYRPANPDNDHDHCAFYKEKFMGADGSDTLSKGYSTADGDYWVCENCFRDFVDMFEWEVVSEI